MSPALVGGFFTTELPENPKEIIAIPQTAHCIYEERMERDLNIIGKISVSSLGFNELHLIDSLSNQIMIICRRHPNLFK